MVFLSQRNFRSLSFDLDEYGNLIGIVTLENVLEEIIGQVADEFDIENPEIVPNGPCSFVILGSTAVQDVENRLRIRFEYADAVTMSGLMLNKTERLLVAGDVIEFPNAIAKVLSVSNDRATKVRLTLVNEK